MHQLRPHHVLLAAVTALTAGGCSSEETKAGLVLAVQTDMAVPENVDQVRIKISVYGDVKHEHTYDVGPSGLQIPATLTLLPPKEASNPVTIEVISFQNSTARTLRQVITTVPKDREALLRVPIQWLSVGMVEEDGMVEADSTVEEDSPPTSARVSYKDRAYVSTCPKLENGDTQSAVNGRCVPDKVDSSKLPTFEKARVFGGATEDGGGACFDTVPCLTLHHTLPASALDLDECTFSLEAWQELTESEDELDPTQLNFGIATGPGGEGVCGEDEDSACYVPLDLDEEGGWRQEDGVVHLPPAVCERLQESESTLELVLSNSCPTKTPEHPTCGPWSSVTGTPITVEVPDGTGGSSGTGGSGGTGGTDGTGASGGTGGTEPGTGGTGGTGGGNNTELGGYYESGTWRGHAFTSADGATISPANFDDLPPGEPFCVTGEVAASADAVGSALLGVRLNQARGEDTLGTIRPGGVGIRVQLTNEQPNTPLWVQLEGTTPSQRWCAEIPATGGTISWGAFSTECWDGGQGVAYTGEAITTASVVVPGGRGARGFNFCLTDLGEEELLSSGYTLIPIDGWVDGASNEVGVQGALFAQADFISQYSQFSNFTLSSMCMEGETALVDVECTPFPPATTCFEETWGAQMGLHLNQPLGDGPESFDASGLLGFTFDVTGPTVPEALHFFALTSQGDFCSGTQLLAGSNQVMFSEIVGACLSAGGSPVDRSDITSIAWRVVASAAEVTAYDFCIENLTALPIIH